MVFAFATKAVMFFTGWTFIVGESLVKGEDCATTRRGTPTCVIHMIFNVVVEGKFIVFISKLGLQKLSNLLLKKIAFTVLVRTGYRYNFVGYFLSTVGVETSSVIHMSTA